MRVEVDDLAKKWFIAKAAELMLTPGELLEAMYQDNDSMVEWVEKYAASKFENPTFWQWLYVSGRLHEVIDLHDRIQDYLFDLNNNEAMDQIVVREEIASCIGNIRLYYADYLSDYGDRPDDTLEKAMKGVLDWRRRKRELLREQLWGKSNDQRRESPDHSESH